MLQVIDWRKNDKIELVDIKDMVSLPYQFVAKLPQENQRLQTTANVVD